MCSHCCWPQALRGLHRGSGTPATSGTPFHTLSAWLSPNLPLPRRVSPVPGEASCPLRLPVVALSLLLSVPCSLCPESDLDGHLFCLLNCPCHDHVSCLSAFSQSPSWHPSSRLLTVVMPNERGRHFQLLGLLWSFCFWQSVLSEEFTRDTIKQLQRKTEVRSFNF